MANLAATVLDLFWSVWTELGVPGHVRNHRGVVLDVEPILVWTPHLFPQDARLRDEVFRWCAVHADRVCVSRLQGLVRVLPTEVADAFADFSATLARHTALRWPLSDLGNGGVFWSAPKSSVLPQQRAALLRFRLRAVAGVGARADVLAELLGRQSAWTSSTDLDYLGYSKRNVARVLDELSRAGVARELAFGNRRAFRLDKPEEWSGIVGDGRCWPRWDLIGPFCFEMVALERLQTRPPLAARVEAGAIRERCVKLANALWMDLPPETRGNPDAVVGLLAWGDGQLRRLADGSSAVFVASVVEKADVTAQAVP